MLGIKSMLGAALLVVAGGLTQPSVAASGDWAVTSVVEYRAVVPGPGHDMIEDRVTITVPEGLSTVWWDTESGGGFATVWEGRIVLTLHPSFGPEGDRQPLDLELSTSDASQPVWSTTLDQATLARATVLTVNLPKKRTVPVGTEVTVSGTLTVNGSPVTDHWVAVGDFRQSGPCDPSCGTSYFRLGFGQVDESGTWRATVSIPWTTRLSASYCMDPSSCWDNPNAPAFGFGASINARWTPALRPPAKPRAGRKATYRVTVPQAYRGVPVVLQARRGDAWTKVGTAKISDSSTVDIRAELPSGKHRVRAMVPNTARQLFPTHTESWTLRRVRAGTSGSATVTVIR